MDEETFQRIVGEEWDAVPAPYRERIQNVALLVEDEPNEEVRRLEGLEGTETLLGIYQGVPLSERGEGYGIGEVLPDTITVYRLPTLLEAEDIRLETRVDRLEFADIVRSVVRDTIWHEIGHYFGHGEEAIMHREEEGKNTYPVV
ncbi:MAG TPA: metallopeptidase family protein [Candidatus Paceibacterota bacterium]|jgi:predicted Zn-dependent protease with MMP-like domain